MTYTRLATLMGCLGVLLLTAGVALAESSDDSCETWEAWEDTPEKSSLWEAISQRNTRLVRNILQAQPCAAKARAQDGRGPLFWAYEFGAKRLTVALIEAGADEDAKDNGGLSPIDMKSEDFDEDYEEEEEEEEEEDEEDENEEANPYEDYDEEEEEEEDEEGHEEL